MTQTLVFLYILVFLYGIIIGSFLNVCIYRIPMKENIVTVGSHCMKCRHKLRWYDLVPIFSWIFLKGKCRYCQEKISAQYPIIEAVNGLAYIIVFAVNGWNFDSILWCLLTSVLLALSIIDYRTMEIPIGMNYMIAGIGIVHLVLHIENWYYFVIGFFLVSLFLLLCLLVTKGKGIGGGDVKLMACAGLCLGWGHVFFAFIIGTVLAAIIQSIVLLITKKGRKFALGPYLSIGIFISMLWGSAMLNWYMQYFIYCF